MISEETTRVIANDGSDRAPLDIAMVVATAAAAAQTPFVPLLPLLMCLSPFA